ncbi:MAG: hypothetical protein JXR96_08580 [Deltaproteobacteria bacterium]|nr:hypothetical protein [Deltaproteobacteria bacterium]
MQPVWEVRVVWIKRIVIGSATLGLLWLIASVAAAVVMLSMRSDVNEQMRALGEIGDGVAETMARQPVPSGQLVDDCQRKLRPEEPGSISFYFAGAESEIEIQLSQLDLSLERQQIRGANADHKLCFHNPRRPYSGDFFDSALTFASESPLRWGEWIQMPSANAPSASAERLAVTLVRRAAAPRVQAGADPRFSAGSALLHTRVVRRDDQTVLCEGVHSVCMPDRILLSGEGATDEEARKKARSSATWRVRDAFVRSLMTAASRSLCFLGGEELCEAVRAAG